LSQALSHFRHSNPTETPPISSTSWQEVGAAASSDALAEYLRETASTPIIQNAMSLAADAMRIHPGDRVLDVGCGAGVFLPKLAEAVGASGSVVALDNVAEFLDQARALVAADGLSSRVEFVLGDARRLPFPDSSFVACHTERVLIHLDDPGGCLREMRRIVRPGGWIVCVEPDLDGMRIDLGDAELAHLIVAGFTETIRHPAMGLELNRRMAAAGLVDRHVATLTEVERVLPEDSAAFLRMGAMRLASQGRANPLDVERAITRLERLSAAGCYTSYSSMFVVAGRVP
jgi:SAM-dependent methyltransferase